jgi:hypothetical protein
MANDAGSTPNGNIPDDKVQKALALLAVAEAKQAARDKKRAEKLAERSAPDYVAPPNASHAFLIEVVESITAANVAYTDDGQFRSYIMGMLGFVDTASKLPNNTTARDFEVLGALIRNTRPSVPVA